MSSVHGLVYNVSKNGLYIRSLDPLPRDTDAWVELRPPRGSEAVHLRGTAMWALRVGSPALPAPPGFGIRIDAGRCPPEDLARLESDPASVRGTHYDVILNGVELGSGSLRNHRADVQRRIFEVLGYGKQDAEARFGFLLNALDAGAPPHGGFAFGYDRWAMLLAKVESLRDVIAFPKTQRGQDLLMDAPSPVESAQTDELGLRVVGRRPPEGA